MKSKRGMVCGMAVVAALAAAECAYAALGGNADTVTADRKALSGVHRASTSRNGYTVEEIASDSTTVREYVSSAGVVFGIAWNGYVHPDLTQLLGSYSGHYSSARKNAPHVQGRRNQRIAADDVVVEKWGHMRNLQGRAYAPALVPSGVSIDEIK